MSKLIKKPPQTLRRWEKEGKITSIRNDNGARWFDIDQLQPFLSEKIPNNDEIMSICGSSVSPDTH